MIRNVLLLLGVLVATFPAGATAATVPIQITKTGFAPSSVTIATGDGVVFTNADTVQHEVVFKKTDGVQCAQPLVLTTGQSGTCAFTKPGKFDYTDPTRKGGAFRGTVNVQQGPTVTLQAVPKLLTYGGKVTLSGSISNGKSGESVSVFAEACGQSAFTRLGTVTTGSGGAFSDLVQPTTITLYEARYKSAASSQMQVKVRPRLRLRKLGPHRFVVSVAAAQSFAGRVAVFQRWSPATRTWIRVRSVVLRSAGSSTLPINPTAVSRARFRSSVRALLRVRVVMPQAQVGSCYAPGRSSTITS